MCVCACVCAGLDYAAYEAEQGGESEGAVPDTIAEEDERQAAARDAVDRVVGH